MISLFLKNQFSNPHLFISPENHLQGDPRDAKELGARQGAPHEPLVRVLLYMCSQHRQREESAGWMQDTHHQETLGEIWHHLTGGA